MDIQVILTENDPKLGRKGDVVKVSSGYAQNFLFPHKKAALATPQALKTAQAEKAREEKSKAEKKAEAESLATRITQTSVTVEVMSGEGDKLFGAVTSSDILDALKKKGISLEKRDIHLEDPIKKLGSYEVSIKLHSGVSAQLKLSVKKKA